MPNKLWGVGCGVLLYQWGSVLALFLPPVKVTLRFIVPEVSSQRMEEHHVVCKVIATLLMEFSGTKCALNVTITMINTDFLS